jgi:hypothetical protein
MATKGTPKGIHPQVQGAQRRAQLTAFLAAQDKPQTLKEIAAALSWPESGTAYTARVAAESGLVKMRKDNGVNLYYMGNGEDPEPEGGEISVVKRKTRITSAKEVELVVAGVLVILGRNPTSGRLRIVLEEM